MLEDDECAMLAVENRTALTPNDLPSNDDQDRRQSHKLRAYAVGHNASATPAKGVFTRQLQAHAAEQLELPFLSRR
jgi:hypothetical protein